MQSTTLHYHNNYTNGFLSGIRSRPPRQMGVNVHPNKAKPSNISCRSLLFYCCGCVKFYLNAISDFGGGSYRLPQPTYFVKFHVFHLWQTKHVTIHTNIHVDGLPFAWFKSHKMRPSCPISFGPTCVFHEIDPFFMGFPSIDRTTRSTKNILQKTNECDGVTETVYRSNQRRAIPLEYIFVFYPYMVERYQDVRGCCNMLSMYQLIVSMKFVWRNIPQSPHMYRTWYFVY